MSCLRIALLALPVLYNHEGGANQKSTRQEDYTRFEPACNLTELNAEYVLALNYKRHTLSPSAPTVCFDQNMLVNTVLHNQLMEQKYSLYHDELTGHAELAGSVGDITCFKGNPRLLARYIWTRFNNSPKHAAIQSNVKLRYVSISCSRRYFVVRLDDAPATVQHDKYKRQMFQAWISSVSK